MTKSFRPTLFAAPVVLASFAIASFALAASGAAPDGKDVFLGQKCNMCHSVSTAGIERTTKSEKMKGPDLVGVLQAHDRQWVTDFIEKKSELDGKKHMKEFSGTADELKALLDWLEVQKK